MYSLLLCTLLTVEADTHVLATQIGGQQLTVSNAVAAASRKENSQKPSSVRRAGLQRLSTPGRFTSGRLTS